MNRIKIDERKNKIIINKLSVESVLKNIKQSEDLYELLMSEHQRFLFENCPKRNLEYAENYLKLFSFNQDKFENAISFLKLEENDFNRKILNMVISI
jgi:hypothetical protein